MMCTIYDAISNRKLARSKIVKTEEGAMTLSNIAKEVEVLMDVSKKFKLVTDDGSYSGKAVPWKKSKSYITVKIDEQHKRDSRRFLRLPCDIKAKLFSCGQLTDCVITELAYGSCMINCIDKLLSEEDATMQFEVGGAHLSLNGVVGFEKESQGSDDDIWFSGYDYMISFEEKYNLENTLDELYGILLRLSHGSLKANADI